MFALISTAQRFSKRDSVLSNQQANSIKNLSCLSHCFLLQKQSGTASFRLVCIKSLLIQAVTLLPEAEFRPSASEGRCLVTSFQGVITVLKPTEINGKISVGLTRFYNKLWTHREDIAFLISSHEELVCMNDDWF